MEHRLEAGSQWYDRIDAEIDRYRISLSEKSSRKFKLDLLLRVTGRVDQFSQTCGECETRKQEINKLVQELSLLTQTEDRQAMKTYAATINNMVEHLKKEHKLVDKGHYLSIGVSIGLAIGGGIGAALGAALDNPGIGTGIGIALGAGIGAYLDRKARDEGRVI